MSSRHLLCFIYILLWASGVSMIVLGGVIHLPKCVIIALGFLIDIGHNMLDGITFEGQNIISIFM